MAWLFPASACPADVLSPVTQKVRYLGDGCRARVAACLESCRGGDAADCYALALAVQDSERAPETAEALFLRACKLGIPSGCTNRAAGLDAGILTEGVADLEVCISRSFERSCERGDAWGCTMLGLHLYTGEGIARDWPRALRVLPGGCADGEDDPACSAARGLMTKIEAGESPPPRPDR
jgi:TPR repeat protein